MNPNYELESDPKEPFQKEHTEHLEHPEQMEQTEPHEYLEKDQDNEQDNNKDIRTFLIPNSEEVVRKKINPKLQINNTLQTLGVFLVRVSKGVVWGYDSGLYEKNEDGKIVRKPRKKKIIENSTQA